MGNQEWTVHRDIDNNRNKTHNEYNQNKATHTKDN